jgi:hypothetical protein
MVKPALLICYLDETERLAVPPRLLLTVTFWGLIGQLIWRLYLPPPLLPSVPINAPVDET